MIQDKRMCQAGYVYAIETVSYSANGRGLLRDVSFNLPPGSLTAVMGLNGSGKTTLLRLMGGWFRPRSGRILLSGKNIQDYPARELARRIAWVPQDFPASFPFTVRQFVRMGRFARASGHPAPSDSAATDAALSRLGIEALAGRAVTTLSGGERQRALLARVLAQDTPVLLLDEPFNHLDIKGRRFVLELLRERSASGVAVVTALHELGYLKEGFTHAVFLRGGELIRAGELGLGWDEATLEKVFETPAEGLRLSA